MANVEIRPKDARFAKQCPQRIQLDVLQPCEPLPDPPFLQMLFRAGDQHEDDTFAGVFEGMEGVEVVDAEDRDAKEWQTMQAVKRGALVIAGGRLPIDHEGHRVGEPDLLVRHGEGYLPIEVKAHKVLENVRKAGSGKALVGGVSDPFLDAAVTDTEHNARVRLDDLLQLAHYRALLESAGIASPACFAAGVIGTEGVLVWHDLDAVRVDAPEHLDDPPAAKVSALVRYDLEFAHRLEISSAAESHLLDESVALVAEPVVCEQCDMCRWREWCGDRMEEVADLSLIAGVGMGKRRLYKKQGVDDLAGLAALDWRTAELFRNKVDVVDLRGLAEGKPGSTPLASVIPKRPKQVEALAAVGFHTVDDLDSLDVITQGVCVEAVSGAASHIELARARTGAAPAYRRRGVDSVVVARGDIEVDVDMENINDGCYLWGALITDRREPEPSPRYVPFATWDPDIEAGEKIAFKEFWSWFTGERSKATAEGATFRAYCYSRNAEQGQMKRIADELGLRSEVDEFIASAEWIDLLEVVKGQLVTGRSMGLKETAPLAGFEWRARDGGGTHAIVKYETAIDDEAGEVSRAEARQWILDYNEDDVRATAALREWLDGVAGDLPSIEVAPGV